MAILPFLYIFMTIGGMFCKKHKAFYLYFNFFLNMLKKKVQKYGKVISNCKSIR